jgi:hypothetical protein
VELTAFVIFIFRIFRNYFVIFSEIFFCNFSEDSPRVGHALQSLTAERPARTADW